MTPTFHKPIAIRGRIALALFGAWLAWPVIRNFQDSLESCLICLGVK